MIYALPEPTERARIYFKLYNYCIHRHSVDIESDSEESDEWYYTDMDDMENERKNNCNIQSN